MPFPSMRVVPDGWAEHHRPAAYGFLTGTCDARGPDRPGGPTGIIYGDPIWEDKPCSVQFLSQSARPTVVVDSTEVQVTHRVSVPIDLDASYGDTITITANPDDPRMTGLILTVIIVESGTTNWTRDLQCVENNQGEAMAA